MQPPVRPVQSQAVHLVRLRLRPPRLQRRKRGRAAGLALAVTDVLPWNNGDGRTAADIRGLNALIAEVAAARDALLLPFRDTLADPADPTRMREGLTDDGDHPSIEGHRLLGEQAFRLPK